MNLVFIKFRRTTNKNIFTLVKLFVGGQVSREACPQLVLYCLYGVREFHNHDGIVAESRVAGTTSSL